MHAASVRPLRGGRALAALVALGMLIAGLPPASTSAQPDEPDDEVAETLDGSSTLAIAVGSGATLGAYEAGYLYYFVQTLKRNRGIARVRMATGTSAGGLNALLALIATCSPPNRVPEDGLEYRAWTNTTLDALHDRAATPAMTMFSRRPMETFMALLRDRWSEGLPETCDVVLGVPVTRRDPYQVSMDGRAARLLRTGEHFVLRLRGRGAGVPPSLENYQDREHGFALALLPVDGENPDEFESLRTLLFASAAFPFAFSPVSLPHCMANVGVNSATTCTPDVAVYADFLDGGLSESRPLGLAAAIARSGLETTADGARVDRYRERPDNRIHDLPAHAFFIELDPHRSAFPEGAFPRVPEPPSNDVMEAGAAFVGTAFEGSRTSEIQTLLETYPEVRESVRSTQVYYPPISTLLSDFFGLVDRQLADFDFVLGMHDARQQLDDEFFPAFAPQASPSRPGVVYPDLDPTSGVAARFACMRAYFDGVGDASSLCAGRELESFRAMLLVTLERLYSNCAQYDDEGGEFPHTHCRAAMEGDAPPDLLETRGDGRWRLPGEADPEVSREAILRLADYGFHFADLGLERDEGHRVLVRLRDRLGAIARDFVGGQDFNHQMLDAVVRAGLNSIQYAPPRVVAHLVLGASSELGVSLGAPYGRMPFLRATFALEIGGLSGVLRSERYAFQFAPTAGLELEPTRLSTAMFQLRVGARAGYRFSTFDHLGRERCGPSNAEQALCTRMVVTTYAAVSLLDVVRLQLTATLLPAVAREERFGWAIGPSLGVQLRSRR